MKPIDLTIPFEWDDRKVVIHDRVWFIPGLLKTPHDFQFPGWEDPHLFGNSNPVVVEYCSGNGLWIIGKAKEFPNINWVAVEIKYHRVRKIWSKIKNEGLPNLIVVCGEAMRATRDHFPAHSFQNAYINFPDPWPKSRHAKNRLIQSNFLQEMRRTLKEEGVVTFVTDDLCYSDWTINIFQHALGFNPLLPAPFYTSEMNHYGTSYFEHLWRQRGKPIRYHQFIKSH